ncbi:MAG: hypothetical protein DMD83_16775 [Candidatus Rokuibacteriota bacterium]|nr:MAG: hypothetical protein DMD83_16775 [Candidatus Rokubacteria bacterium]
MRRIICMWTMSGLLGLSALAWPTPAPGQTPPAPASADVASLRERSAAFWAAKVAANFTGQWELLEPRGRGRLRPEEYAHGRGGIKYLAYQVEDATVNGQFAVVKVKLLLQPKLTAQRRIEPQAVTVQDRWVRIAGIWYRSLEQDGEPGLQTGQR